ncbi:uncharacterized protein LOC114517130 isoform X2 [Dendronephthya gigantea]|uniref:uncharacterized protein LOC114517130 isoform X2 n=1 Tax=Dendronephthya gigantea TaxID=151771 RepID=UPI00106BAA46|nr:uncharacterized protein LOC114517130 isoform X2 [Dendronephthya gigantea]
MNTLLLLVLVTVSSSIVFAKSQRSCLTSDDCEKDGCCFNGICSYESSYKCIHQKCSSNSDCSLPTESCCVNKKCQACTNDYSDGYEDRNGGSSSGSSGSSTTLAIAIIIPIKIALCFCCICCKIKRGQERDEARRQENLRDGMVRRETCNIAVVLVEHDELQRQHEHAQAEQIEIGRPPPPYYPQTDHHENTTQDTEQNNLSFIINPIENSNMEPIRGAQGTGDTEKVNGVPEDATMFPPHDHPIPSVNFPPVNFPPNTTEQNSTQKELMQFQPLQNTAF